MSSLSPCTRSGSRLPFSMRRLISSSLEICQFLRSFCSSSVETRSALPAPPFLPFFAPPCSCSISASVDSTCRDSSSTWAEMKFTVSCLSCSRGSSRCPALRPSLENAFVFISFSHALKRSICCVMRRMVHSRQFLLLHSNAEADSLEPQQGSVAWSLGHGFGRICRLTVSISLRFSVRAFLSLISLLASHVLIWSRNRCSFLICVLSSASTTSCER